MDAGVVDRVHGRLRPAAEAAGGEVGLVEVLARADPGGLAVAERAPAPASVDGLGEAGQVDDADGHAVLVLEAEQVAVEGDALGAVDARSLVDRRTQDLGKEVDEHAWKVEFGRSGQDTNAEEHVGISHLDVVAPIE